MTHIQHWNCALVAAVTLASACATEMDGDTLDPTETADDAAEVTLDPIAHVALANGNDIEFYEPLPGRVLVLERGIDVNEPTQLAGRTPLEVFADIAPDRAVPAALLAAQQRADELADELPDDASGETAARLVDSGQTPGGHPALTDAPVAAAFDCKNATQFVGKFCGAGDQKWCLLNWWNGAYAFNSSVNYVDTGLCSISGWMRLRLLIDSVPKADWWVGSGGYLHAAWIQQPFWIPIPLPPFVVKVPNRFGFYLQVLDASGDKFHFGGAAGDY